MFGDGVEVYGGAGHNVKVPGGNCIKIGLPENQFSETIFKVIGLPGETFSLTENQFSRKTYFYTIDSRERPDQNTRPSQLLRAALLPAEADGGLRLRRDPAPGSHVQRQL